jgi:hypothetical protein
MTCRSASWGVVHGPRDVVLRHEVPGAPTSADELVADADVLVEFIGSSIWVPDARAA